MKLLPPATAARLLAANPATLLVDVREPVEFAAGHIEGAQNIPLGEIKTRAHSWGRGQTILLNCQAGTRSATAAAQLRELGFTAVLEIEGGFSAWQAAAQPVSQATHSGLPLMRQVQLTIGTGVLGGCLLTAFVHPWCLVIPAFFGAGLIFAGSTGWCGLALLMARMPWNRVS